MDMNLAVTKDIVKAIAPTFNGDARHASNAFQRISATLMKFTDDEAKALTGSIVVEMGPQFKGNLDSVCEAFERIYATIINVKRGQPGA